MNRGGRGIFAAGGIAVAFGVYLVAAGGAVFLAPLLNSSVPVTRPAGTAVTTTRAGAQYDVDGSNVVQSCAANTGCYNATKGLKSQSQVVPLATFALDFSHATWTKTNVTVTADADSGPFASVNGGPEADRLVVTNATHSVVQTVTVTASTAYVMWFWAKNNSGTAPAYSVFDATGAANIIAPTAYGASINNSTYSLIAVPFTTPVGCTSINIYPLRNSGAGVDLFITGMHLAAASGPTSVPCPRVAALASNCNADVHTVPTTGWPTGSGEISVVYTPNEADAANSQILFDSRTTSTTNGVVISRPNDERARIDVYGSAASVCAAQSAVLTWTPGTAKTIEGRWDGSSCSIVVDGVVLATAAATGAPDSHDPAGANVGSSSSGGFQANGWERTLCVGRVGGCP